ncbi:MAG TPA: S8 family serine peptidase, partial [Candidatus Polarisedimenticolia bacterium]|nr:S8 family serine peptidase [Candidatus Polarisedimenticolia bacterium]
MIGRPFRRERPSRGGWLVFLLTLSIGTEAPRAGAYITETSGIRWNDVGGIRWNDVGGIRWNYVGGIRWNDVGGIRWNDVGGIRWNDVGGTLFTDASGIRWNDVGGIRWNDVGGTTLDDALATGETSLDLELLNQLSFLPDTSSINVIVTYRSAPNATDFVALNALGIFGGTVFRKLPMVVVDALPDQIRAIAALARVRSVYFDRTLSFFDTESRDLIGMGDVESDPDLLVGGTVPSGAGVTIAVLDTGVDATHPDLPFGAKVLENVRVNTALNTGPGFVHPVPVEGLANTDLILGHGTSVASVAAGGMPVGGDMYRGIAPGAKVLALSAGDLFITNVLEGFDYTLDNASRFGVRVLNCSWGTEGFFDPDDPVNIATRALYDAGITVVFAAGNYGPAVDTLNPYSVAPWVIGVGSTRKDGKLSEFSSRGIFEELLYHPTLAGPGEDITAAVPPILNGGAAYAAVSGTSFAAPHVAGVVALLLETHPTLTPSEIKRILQQTATPILGHDRSEIGAGSLDAWAALTQTQDPGRPFGTYIPGWLDARPYRIVHRPPVTVEATVPAGGMLAVPISASEPVVSMQISLAWGTFPAGNDLDLRVISPSGKELGRSEALNGTSLFGRAEGLHMMGAVPSPVTAYVSYKAGTGIVDQPFEMRWEPAVAQLIGYDDLGTLPPALLETLTRAVSRHVIEGRGSQFDPYDALTRGELARSLALTAELPQRIAAQPTFPDTGSSEPEYPFVETVAGVKARRHLMEAVSGHAFKAGEDVNRLDFAVAMVRAAGL